MSFKSYIIKLKQKNIERIMIYKEISVLNKKKIKLEKEKKFNLDDIKSHVRTQINNAKMINFRMKNILNLTYEINVTQKSLAELIKKLAETQNYIDTLEHKVVAIKKRMSQEKEESRSSERLELIVSRKLF